MWATPDVINLSTARVAIGPLREDLAPLYNRWRNDFWAQRTYGFPIRPVSLDMTVEEIQGYARSSDCNWFTIYKRDTWQPIGMTDLQNIQLDHRTAEFGIGILESSMRGQGYGTESTRLMLFYGFRLLGLHVITLTVDGANPGGKRAYEKAGFKFAGRYREAIMVDAKRFDLIHMDILASEFTGPDDIVWGMPETSSPAVRRQQTTGEVSGEWGPALEVPEQYEIPPGLAFSRGIRSIGRAFSGFQPLETGRRA